MNKIFRAYHVWPRFPSISMSGNSCYLNCKHCNHVYLNDMKNLTKPQDFYESCKGFYDEGAVGFLLSGGCNKNGEMLNLSNILPIVKRIKRETDLIVKLHTGFVDKPLSEEIVSSGVDIASVEVVGSDDTIKKIFDFNSNVDCYKKTLQNLEDAGMPFIVPHICIGLHYGKLNGEFNALSLIKEFCKPELLVFIIFRPTKGTILEDCSIPNEEDVSVVIKKAKKLFPKKDISLGCIRPRAKKRDELEIAALKAGVNRMEIPSKKTIQYAKQLGYTIKNINACCALPEIFEENAI